MPQRAPKRSPWLEVTFAMVVVSAAAFLAWSMRKDEPTTTPTTAMPSPTYPEYGLEPGPCIVHPLENVSLEQKGSLPALNLRMSYPEGDGPFAVIIFVPGPKSYQGVMDWLVNHWVSHGYVVIEHYLPETRGWPGKPPKGSPPGSSGPKRDYQLEQLATVRAIVDAVPELMDRVPALQGMVDAQRIGLAGMGIGGQLSLLLGGATATLTEPTTTSAAKSTSRTSSATSTGATHGAANESAPTDSTDAPKPEQKLFQDDRLWAVASFWNGFAPGSWSMEQQALETLHVPALLVTSPWDRHPKTQAQGWRRDMFEYAPPGGRYMLSLSSSMPAPPSKPSSAATDATPADPEANERRDREARRYQRMTENLRMTTTAFFDAYLRDSDTALYFLRSDAIEQRSYMRTRLEKK